MKIECNYKAMINTYFQINVLLLFAINLAQIVSNKYFHISNCMKITCFNRLNPISLKKICDDPIDIVYTYVNGSDPKWIQSFDLAYDKYNISMKIDTFKIRYIENDELRFSLRSIEKYALHFIRYIFIVVANNDSQIPFWLDVSNPRIKIVTHDMIFKDVLKKEKNSIFSFNSNSIENCLSNIQGLSEKFIYFNDDIFLGQKVEKNDFFENCSKPKIIVRHEYFSNVEQSYYSMQDNAKNDFAGQMYYSSHYYTLFQFQKKFNKISNVNLLHVAYPTTKKIQNGYKKEFQEQVLKTIESPFRQANDIIMSQIALQYGLYTNDIIPLYYGNSNSIFVYDDFFSNKNKLFNIYRNRAKFFCINIDVASQASLIKSFLYIIFPNKSSFELENAEPPKISEKNLTNLYLFLNH